MPNLESLEIDENKSQIDIRSLRGIKHLKAHGSGFSDDTLRYLIGIKSLTLVDGSGISNEGMPWLYGIEVLRIYRNSRISDHGLYPLIGSIKDLYLPDNTKITDLGLRALFNVECMTLGSPHITSKGLGYLKNIKKLNGNMIST
jgi:hypothetical protein